MFTRGGRPIVSLGDVCVVTVHRHDGGPYVKYGQLNTESQSVRCFKRGYEDRCSPPWPAVRPGPSAAPPSQWLTHAPERVSVCSMRCDTRESARPPSPSPGPARPAPRRDFVPSDNGCMWGQRAFYERRERERASLFLPPSPHKLFYFFVFTCRSSSTSSSSPAHHLSPPVSAASVGRYDNRVAYVAQRGITPSLRSSVPHRCFCVSFSLPGRSSFRLHSAFLVPILLPRSSAVSKPLPSSGVQFPPVRPPSRRCLPQTTGRPLLKLEEVDKSLTCRPQPALVARAKGSPSQLALIRWEASAPAPHTQSARVRWHLSRFASHTERGT